MFVLPKSFEYTLRSPIVPATPNNPGSGLNPAFHKGCTGKAHACGTMKSKLNKPIPPPRPDKWHRKNSISSETVSESGSEKSTLTCNLSANEDQATSKRCPNELSVYNLKRNDINAISPLPTRRNCKVTVNTVLNRSPSIRSIQRTRLHSEGDKSPEFNNNISNTSAGSTFERTQKNRSFRLNKSSTVAKVATPSSSPSSNIRPPWNSAAASAKSHSPSSPAAVLSNRIFRSSLRRRNDAAIQWHTLWERSLQMRGSSVSGGLYKNYDEIIKKKVCTQFFYMYVHILI